MGGAGGLDGCIGSRYSRCTGWEGELCVKGEGR